MNANYHITKEVCFKHAIHAIWQVDDTHVFKNEVIIPKGVVEVIFNFSDTGAIPVQIGSKQHQLSNCFINGFNTVPIQLQLPKQQVFFGVLFQPLAVKKILKTPAGKFSDLAVDLTLIDPAFQSLWYQLAEQPTFNKRVFVFLAWLRKYMIEWEPREQLMNNFLCGINQRKSTVPALANSLCYSPRHLSRKLFEATGMNAEEFLLYKKYLHAVNLIRRADFSLTDVALQSNFTDQSHFIKTFKNFAAITPGEYKRTRSSINGHIYKDVR